MFNINRDRSIEGGALDVPTLCGRQGVMTLTFCHLYVEI